MKSILKKIHLVQVFLLVPISLYAKTLKEKISLNGKIEQCFFTPEDNITEILTELIKEEKNKIQVAMYYLSEYRIIKELIEAKKRDITVEVIIDNICVTKLNMNNLHKLADCNIPLKVFNIKALKGNSPIMHHKYFIFENNVDGKSILTTGSFNCTYTAQAKNKENLIITENLSLISKFQKNFAQLKEQVKDLAKKRRYIRWLIKVKKIRPKYL
jgi:mitochondrial cardiolipin hydrolase